MIKKTFGRRTCRWKDNIKIHLKDIEWKVVEWIHLAQVGEKWRAVVETAMNLRVP
jgi:hypothetical protein